MPVYNWGYEWLRDGLEIAAHYHRFEGNGRYKRWLDSGDMADFLLLDFRSTVPREPHPRKYCGIYSWYLVLAWELLLLARNWPANKENSEFPKLYHICFEENFRRVSVRNCLLQVEATFVLAECK